ncbi:efflux RND transporter periplasmic adaptor subunit [Larkinella punicea]|jgi:Cu(I)/Ag(I) efflux system membrane fusion protein|uniref:Efflux RND transporter periplasmic adaptor subunit n=1 Tax=Larkinella punicea TaxID=2315727 RepID=A0A368JHG1_9BACT|nr:efflux RND transporter periplasmic adaptor subunit [Larkinella punicea]RCR67097.1 efflux RND transporter periplasmic adaptor subunit [Larkinella punicea]
MFSIGCFYPFSWKQIILFLLMLSYPVGCTQKEHLSGEHPSSLDLLNPQEVQLMEDIAQSTNHTVISNQTLVKPKFVPHNLRVPIKGYLTYDSRRNNKVAIRVGGRIEKLYYKYNYQFIHKGDKIMDLYSPEINTYQAEFLYLLQSDNDPNLIEKGREKLRLLGLSDDQIGHLEKTGKFTETIAVHSPYQGYILFETALDAETSMGDSGSETEPNGMKKMNSNSEEVTSYSTYRNDELREGNYVNTGQTLFSVNDLNILWAIGSYETRMSFDVRLNDPVILYSDLVPNQKLAGRVNFIEPIFQKNQKFTQVRIYLNNSSHRLKINALVSGILIPRSSSLFVVPVSSVYDLGRRKIIWVYAGKTPSGKKRFKARQVLTGVPQDGYIPILQGLNGQEEIAQEAGYLVDSESYIEPSVYPF